MFGMKDNFVAKHFKKFNKHVVHKSKKDYERRPKHKKKIDKESED